MADLQREPEPVLVRPFPTAARMLDVGRTKIYDLISRNLIESVDFDGRKMVVVASLRRLAEPARAAS